MKINIPVNNCNSVSHYNLGFLILEMYVIVKDQKLFRKKYWGAGVLHWFNQLPQGWALRFQFYQRLLFKIEKIQ